MIMIAWQDDTWPTQQSSYMGEFSFQNGVEIFKEQVPIGDNTYRTLPLGKGSANMACGRKRLS